MKINLFVILFTIIYFLTSNWIISDYFISINTKNIIVGILLIGIIITRLNKKINYSRFMNLFSIIIFLSVANNYFINKSLLFQSFFLFIFSFLFFNDNEILKIYKLINRVNYFFLILLIIQIILIFKNQNLLKYSYPLTSTDLEFNTKVEVKHWIQYFGNMTNERFEYFGKILPRFSSYISEPSGVANLIIIPLIIETLITHKKIISHTLIILSLGIIFRSGFLTLFILWIFITLIFNYFKILRRKSYYLLLITIFSISIYLLSSKLGDFLYLLNESNLYSLQNKNHSVGVRLYGLGEMLKNINFFGNHKTEIYGVGLIFHYLILYGYPIIFILISLLINLKKNNKLIILNLILFDYFFLSKGFSSIFGLILLYGYSKIPHTNNNNPQ